MQGYGIPDTGFKVGQRLCPVPDSMYLCQRFPEPKREILSTGRRDKEVMTERHRLNPEIEWAVADYVVSSDCLLPSLISRGGS